MDTSEEITRKSNRLMEVAVEDAQSLLGKRDPNALLAVALASSLAALTLEIRGLRQAQERMAGLTSLGMVQGEPVVQEAETARP